MPVVRVAVAARILTHRRDEHPIGERQISNRERVKQASHCEWSHVSRHSPHVRAQTNPPWWVTRLPRRSLVRRRVKSRIASGSNRPGICIPSCHCSVVPRRRVSKVRIHRTAVGRRLRTFLFPAECEFCSPSCGAKTNTKLRASSTLLFIASAIKSGRGRIRC